MAVRLAVLVLVMACLTGCMSTLDGVGIVGEPAIADDTDTVRTKQETEIVRDPHSGITVVSGPIIAFTNGDAFHNVRLRAWIDPRKPRGNDAFAIVVRGKFHRRVYLSAAFSRGEKLPLRKHDAERVCDGTCVVYETVEVPMDEQDLIGHSASGITFRVSGRRDTIVVRVPAGHFAGFHASYAAERDGLMPPR